MREFVYQVDVKDVGRRAFSVRIKLRDDVHIVMKSGGFERLELRDHIYDEWIIAGHVKHQRPFSNILFSRHRYFLLRNWGVK